MHYKFFHRSQAHRGSEFYFSPPLSASSPLKLKIFSELFCHATFDKFIAHQITSRAQKLFHFSPPSSPSILPACLSWLACDPTKMLRQTWSQHGKAPFESENRKCQKRKVVSHPKKIFSSSPCNKNLILDSTFFKLLNLISVEYAFGLKSLSEKLSEREARLQIRISHTKGKLHTAKFPTFPSPTFFFRENF